MADRISRKRLQDKVDYIGRMLGRPAIGWENRDGKYTANAGHLFIDYYNPGDNPYSYKLVELNKHGGEHRRPAR